MNARFATCPQRGLPCQNMEAAQCALQCAMQLTYSRWCQGACTAATTCAPWHCERHEAWLLSSPPLRLVQPMPRPAIDLADGPALPDDMPSNFADALDADAHPRRGQALELLLLAIVLAFGCAVGGLLLGMAVGALQ